MCPTRTGRAHERFILIENVVYADVDFPQLVAKDLLAHEQVAEQIAVVVIVRETQILDIRSAAREGESPAEDKLERRRSLMVEITVLSSGSGEGIDGFVVRAVPRKGEVHILGDVAAQHYARFVTEVARVVPLAVHEARNTRIAYAAPQIQVTLDEIHRKPVTRPCPHIPVAVHIRPFGELQRTVNRIVDLQSRTVAGAGRNIVLGRFGPEHQHKSTALLRIGIDVVHTQIMAVRRP